MCSDRYNETQVCQYYAHTFEKFHFHNESDATFETLNRFVCSKNACTQIMVKIAGSVLKLFKEASFQNNSSCRFYCCCCSA